MAQRLFDAKGRLVPTGAKDGHQQAEAERQRAETERQRAEAEHQRAETERRRAETEHQRVEAERQWAEVAEAGIARLHEELARYQTGTEEDS